MRRLLQAIGVVALLLALAGCGRPPVLVPYDGPVADEQSVLVATSRATDPEAPAGYGGGRAERLQFAEYRISVPPERRLGDVSFPGAKPDPARDFLTTGVRGFDGEAGFVAAINSALARAPRSEQRVILYVHGYRTSFDGSVLQAAQLAEDYALAGPMVVFSWPSAGLPTHYLYDRDSALVAREQLVATLRALAKTRAREVVLVAHSMGGFLAMEGLLRLRDRGDTRTLNRISAVVLADADIDFDVFRAQARGLDLTRLALVVIASERDLVLDLSSFIAGGRPRVGSKQNLDELRRMGVFVVDVSQFDDGTLLGHYAFQRSPELIEMVGSGELTAALAGGQAGENLAVRALGAVGDVVMAVAYIPYRLTR